jgi:ankyrin repeat protein
MTLPARQIRNRCIFAAVVVTLAALGAWLFSRFEERDRLTRQMVAALTTGKTRSDDHSTVAIDLVKRGANPNARLPVRGTKPARSSFWARMLKFITGRSALSDQGFPVLMDAVTNGQTDFVNVLLEHGAEPNTIAEYPRGGFLFGGPRSALFCAVMFGRSEIVEALLVRHADPNVRDSQKRTSLIFAVQVLADLNELTVNSNAPHRTETFGLVWALGEESMRRRPEARWPDQRVEAFERGLRDSYVSIIRGLLSHGADVNAKDYMGSTALSYVRGRKGNKALTEMLVRAGAR